jgi:hypothetical protein
MGDNEPEVSATLRLFCEKFQRSIEKRIERYEERMIFQWQHFEEMQQRRFELMERRIFQKIEKEREEREEREEHKGITGKSHTKTSGLIRSEEDIRKDKEIERLHKEQIEANLQKSVEVGLKRAALEAPKSSKIPKLGE